MHFTKLSTTVLAGLLAVDQSSALPIDLSTLRADHLSARSMKRTVVSNPKRHDVRKRAELYTVANPKLRLVQTKVASVKRSITPVKNPKLALKNVKRSTKVAVVRNPKHAALQKRKWDYYGNDDGGSGPQVSDSHSWGTTTPVASGTVSASISKSSSASVSASKATSASKSASASVSKSASVSEIWNPKNHTTYASHSTASASSSASTTIWWTPSTTISTLWWTPTTEVVSSASASTTVWWTPTSQVTSSSTPLSSSSAAVSTASASHNATSTASATSAAATSTATATANSSDFVSAAYYADWTSDELAPADIDFKLYDLIKYAFAIPSSSGSLTLDGDESTLEKVVKYAHAANASVVIAIGGWDDSTYFSGIVSTTSGQKKFAKNIKTFVEKYNLDGVDIDWEYPGTVGASGNEESSDDSANFLAFLGYLRDYLGSSKIISACTTDTTFTGSDGNPLSDVSDFADLLDHILVMNYDAWGASSEPGPNAPLSDKCGDSEQPSTNQEAAIEAWTTAGMPAKKIIMGVPGYGYVSQSSATSLVHKRALVNDGLSNRDIARRAHQESKKSFGTRWYETGKKRAAARQKAKRAEISAMLNNPLNRRMIVCPNDHSGTPCAGISGQDINSIDWMPVSTAAASATGTASGVFTGGPATKVSTTSSGDVTSLEGNQVDFNELITYGVLKQATNGSFVGDNGYTRAWDSCSSTPFAYDTSRDVVVTYDDDVSMKLKGKMAAEKNILGIGMWEISGDTDDHVLANAFRAGMGLSTDN